MIARPNSSNFENSTATRTFDIRPVRFFLCDEKTEGFDASLYLLSSNIVAFIPLFRRLVKE